MKSLPLMRLQLAHAFYKNGLCPDIEVKPTPRTQGIFLNHRCTLKTFPSGLQVFITVNKQNFPLIPLTNGTKFEFYLYIRNPDFPLFTDLTQIWQQASPLFVNSEMGNNEINRLSLTSRYASARETFEVQEPSTEERFVFGGKPLKGIEAHDLRVEDLEHISTAKAYNPITKIMTVDTTLASQGTVFSVTYPVRPNKPNNVFAFVEIKYDQQWGDVSTHPKEFQIDFSAKEAKWQYYLLTDKQDAQFEIEDKGDGQIQFDGIQLSDNSDTKTTDPFAQALAEKHPHLTQWVFRSANFILCQQQPRKSLRLNLEGETVLSPLPNPPVENFSRLENDATQKEEILFQTIRYLTHSDQLTGGN